MLFLLHCCNSFSHFLSPSKKKANNGKHQLSKEFANPDILDEVLGKCHPKNIYHIYYYIQK
jgi:hypothetical protein